MRSFDCSFVLRERPEELRRLQRTRGLAMSAIGFVVYWTLKLFGQRPKYYHDIFPYFEVGHRWGGLSLGWFFVCQKNASDNLKNHELGHCIQNAAVGGLKMLGLSIKSAFRYWKIRITKSSEEYDSWWFEKQASEIGAEYITNFINNRNGVKGLWN